MKKILSLLSLLLCVLFIAQAQLDERPSNPGAVTPPPRVTKSVNTDRRSTNNSVSVSGLNYSLSSSLNSRQVAILESMINDMVYVEGGTFMMGATSEQGSDADSDEKPVHQVTVSNFYISKYELTQEVYEAVMGSNPVYESTKGSRRPVTNINWDDVQQFLRKLSNLTGLEFSIPTGAEWEYAARGGKYSRGYKYSGSNSVKEVAWYKDNSSDGTHDVGLKKPNELGLYDMSGNVDELCNEWKGSYTSTAKVNPQGPSTGTYRLCRGGYYSEDADDCRVAARSVVKPESRYSTTGIRLVVRSNGTNPQNVTYTNNQQQQQNYVQPSNGATYEQQKIINQIISNMVKVDGGTFMMGSSKSDESPIHQVTLSDYYIGKYEVTQKEWEAIMGSNPTNYGKGPDIPVTNMSWDDCQEFIRKLSQLSGYNFDMPTEAEWEYAARGGKYSKGYKFSGSNKAKDVAWFKPEAKSKQPVGLKKPNELGIYDMSGNMGEWVSDWRGAYSAESQYNPKGPSSGKYKAYRGGYFMHEDSDNLRVTWRSNYYKDKPISIIGLRLVLRETINNNNYSNNNGGNVSPNTITGGNSNMSAAQKAVIEDLYNNMLEIDGGTFMMGATSEQGSDVDSDEKPVHQVTLSNFYICKYEVTQKLWETIMGDIPYQLDKGPNKPVTSVSWDDCQKFIKKLNSLTGLKFRLPTEAEWEYAARGGKYSKGYKYSGGNSPKDVAWYKKNSDGDAQEVGQKKPNELGLYDMSGNAGEWVSDWKASYSAESQYNPTGANSGTYKVYRGGHYYDDKEKEIRVSYRSNYNKSESLSFVGFRLALTYND